MPYGWDDAYGARIGVMPLDRPGEVTWFDVDPAYVFHVGNAHTDAAGRVVLDAARYAPADAVAMWDGLGPEPRRARRGRGRHRRRARMHRWVLDPATGTVTETPLADRPVEFPTVDDERVGREARYRYAVGTSRRGEVRRRRRARSPSTRSAPTRSRARPCSCRPPRPTAPRTTAGCSRSRPGATAARRSCSCSTPPTSAGAPVAAVTLPRGVPAGFHGSWIPDEEPA